MRRDSSTIDRSDNTLQANLKLPQINQSSLTPLRELKNDKSGIEIQKNRLNNLIKSQ